MSAEYRSRVGRHEPTSMSADTRPILHRHSAATRPPLGRHLAATRPILYQHSANTKLTWSALNLLPSSIFPALLGEAFSDRRPYLTFNSGIGELIHLSSLSLTRAVASWVLHSTPAFEPWPGTLCWVLGHDTLLSPCLSPSLHMGWAPD